MKSIVRSLAVEMALQQRATGRRIAQLRERARMTQEVAADKAGVTLRAYQKWEAGGGIQYANLQKLAEVFRVPVERITGEEDTPDPFATASQLDRIERNQREILRLLHTLTGPPAGGRPLTDEDATLPDAHLEVPEPSRSRRRRAS